MNRKLIALSLAVAALASCATARDNNAPKANKAAEPYKYNEYYYQRASLFDILPIEPGDIVMFGNSLTNGCEWSELLKMPNVKNRGINSDVIQGLRDRVGSIVSGKPAKIFLLSGTNDVSHNLTPDSIARATGQLIDDIQAASPTTKIYLQSLLPIDNSFNRYKAMIGKEQVIRDTNVLLEQLAKDKGVTWVNLYPLFIDENSNLRRGLSNDGLHLLAPGYLIWRDAIIDYIKE